MIKACFLTAFLVIASMSIGFLVAKQQTDQESVSARDRFIEHRTTVWRSATDQKIRHLEDALSAIVETLPATTDRDVIRSKLFICFITGAQTLRSIILSHNV